MKLYLENNESIPAVIVQDDITAAPIGFTEASTAENFDKYCERRAKDFSGLGFGVLSPSYLQVDFYDWKTLQEIIKAKIEAIAGATYATWALLSATEKQIALKYCPTKIIDGQGLVFFATEAGGAVQADEYIRYYIKSASTGRSVRFDKLISYAYNKLGKADGLKAERQLRKDFEKDQFEQFGTLLKAEDGLEGIEDWLLSTATTIYATNGLISRLTNAEFTVDDPALTDQQFCNNCRDIVRSGKSF